MDMDCGDIDANVKSKLLEEVKYLPDGMCFTRCEYAPFTNSTYRCWLALPEQQVRFFVHYSVLRDDQGDKMSPGQFAKFGSKGWALGQIASPNRNDLMVVRLILNQGDSVEFEIGSKCVITK